LEIRPRIESGAEGQRKWRARPAWGPRKSYCLGVTRSSMRLSTMFLALLSLPTAAASPRVVRLLKGSSGVHEVSVAVTTADAGAPPGACASSLLRALVGRPGMPDRDSIYRAPLDQETFLVLYRLGTASERQLHAHLLSSASARHCVEVHVSRPERPGEEFDEWRKSFATSHIQASGR
jgi:hypothetical protein